jgi:hypothetical protein
MKSGSAERIPTEPRRPLELTLSCPYCRKQVDRTEASENGGLHSACMLAMRVDDMDTKIDRLTKQLRDVLYREAV